MSPQVYYFLHVGGMFLMVAITHRILVAGGPKSRRPMILVGTAALIALVAGFGLLAKLGYDGLPNFVLIKLACWLGIAAVPSLVKRKPVLAKPLGLLTTVLVLGAVAAVYLLRGA